MRGKTTAKNIKDQSPNRIKNFIIPLSLVLVLVVLFMISERRSPEGYLGMKQEQIISTKGQDLKVVHQSETTGLYTNGAYKFSIRYPLTSSTVCGNGDAWEYFESQNSSWVGFGPLCSKSGGYIWGIAVYQNGDVEKIIKQIGGQFSDRKETRGPLSINGIDGVLVTVTTNQIKDWAATTAVLVKDGTVVTISDGAGSDPSEFKQFYSSFVFNK